MSKSFDGLAGLVQQTLKLDPFSTHLFVFFNKAKEKVKILYWDHNGFAIWYKRLEKGVFRIPRIQHGEAYSLSMSELCLLLEGIDLTCKDRFNEERYAIV
jgi:transposase